MSARFDLVTLDARDAEALVLFWSRALGLVVTETEDDGRWTVLGDADGSRRLGIQRVDETESGPAAVWAGPTKARVHIDLSCEIDEFEDEVDRLLGLGAVRLRDDRVESYGAIATLADPEGNIFDLCAYGGA